MARLTFDKIAVVDLTTSRITSEIYSNAQDLFSEIGIRKTQSKIGTRQAVYKLRNLNEDLRLLILKSDSCYTLEYYGAVENGQLNYNECFYSISTVVSKMISTLPIENSTPKKPLEMNNNNQEAAQQMMQLMMQMMSGGAINEDAVKKIVDQKLAEINKPKIERIEFTLPDGSEKAVEGQHKKFKTLLACTVGHVPQLLVGPAGSGKTYGAKMAAKSLNMDFRIVSFTNEMSLGRTIGFMSADGRYVSTPIREMYENGGLLILDEIDAAHPNVAMAMNNLLDGEEYSFPDKTVKRHKDFMYHGCANTFGTGATKKNNARNKLDDATIDRFFGDLVWDYDESFEIRLFGDTEATRTVQAIRKNANKMQLEGLITPRRTRAVNRMVGIGIDLKEAINIAILNRQKLDVQKGLMEGINI